MVEARRGVALFRLSPLPLFLLLSVPAVLRALLHCLGWRVERSLHQRLKSPLHFVLGILVGAAFFRRHPYSLRDNAFCGAKTGFLQSVQPWSAFQATLGPINLPQA